MNKLFILFLAAIFALTNVSAQSWTQQNIGFIDSSAVLKISIANDNSVWCVSSPYSTINEYSRTTSGGTVWMPGTINSFPAGSVITAIAAVDSSTAYVCVDLLIGGGAIYKTTDGGINWSQSGAGVAFNDSNSFPNEIYFWNAANGFAYGDPVGGYNEIFTTTDSGNTWVQTPSSNIPPNTLGSVSTFGALQVIDSMIWFPTNSGVVYKSIDRGYNWTSVNIDTTGPVYNVSFLDDKMHGIATGASHVFESSDGGNTWSVIPPSVGSPLYLVKAIPGTNYFVCVDYLGASSSYSADYGHTWMIFDSQTMCYGLAFKDINTGFAGGVPVGPATGGIYKWDPAILGVNAISSNQFALYPNPVSEELVLSNHDIISEINIYDLFGKEIIISKPQSSIVRINVCDLVMGIYYVRVKSGGKFQTKKFIKM